MPLGNNAPEGELRPVPRAVPTQPRRRPRKTAASAGTPGGAQESGAPSHPARLDRPPSRRWLSPRLAFCFCIFGGERRGELEGSKEGICIVLSDFNLVVTKFPPSLRIWVMQNIDIPSLPRKYIN